MLFAQLRQDGTLEIRATEEIEAYALRQWEEHHKNGKAVLKLETGRAYSVDEIAKALGTHVADFQKWYFEQQGKAVIPGLKVGQGYDRP